MDARKTQDENVNRASDMIRTMIMLYLGIFLTDLVTSSINLYWTIGAAIVVGMLYLFNWVGARPRADKTKVFNFDSEKYREKNPSDLCAKNV
ncbi:MAG TPA: hypothetical protein PKI42_10440 [Cyclobacteriaceae bacterium]|nr:hypothetical protein [Cyclobacteriaceae bacterium]HMX88021.1 hypothetical protein [Saprospiraceae bacterium]HNL45223.1 hypothetical protein [Cyclobacteriaceae bacterium]